MTDYERPTERPDMPRFHGFDHIRFYVSNAHQAASYYITRFGFEPYAYAGLETGSRETATHVVKQGDAIFAFTSPLLPQETKMSTHIALKGDAVKDVAFAVEDCRAAYEKAVARGAEGVLEPEEMKDENGSVIRATVKTYGETVHTFIQRDNFTGTFLPGYKAIDEKDPLATLLPSPGIKFVDHVVGNQPDDMMVPACDWYQQTLNFHRFWSVDDKQLHTKFSALRSIVMTDFDRTIKMPINEPAEGVRKSQIQEYVDYHGGAGVQHIALNVDDIIHTISNLRARGVKFLSVPDAYYENVKKRLAEHTWTLEEDIEELKKLNILIDFDENGYLLQLFTKCVEDRPTLFLELIQRHGNEGFGAGNFKALFESIERDQAARGNL